MKPLKIPGLTRAIADALRFWVGNTYPTDDYKGTVITWYGREYVVCVVAKGDYK